MEAITLSLTGLGAVMLGHYGGLDEIGIFVIPALLAFVLLRWADRRARRKVDEETRDETEGAPSTWDRQ